MKKQLKVLIFLFAALFLISAVSADVYPAGYGQYAQTILHMNGTNGGTTFTDDLGKTVTPNGVTTSTLTKEFGTASANFAGNAYLTIGGSSSNYTFMSDGENYTWIVWANTSTFSNYQGLFDTATGSAYNLGTTALISPTRDIIWQIYYGSAVNYILNLDTGASGYPNDGLWHQIMGQYNNATGTGNVYVDGILKKSQAKTANTPSSSAPYNSLVIGAYAGFSFAGNADEIGIYKDIVIPNSTIYPQTQEFNTQIITPPTYPISISNLQIWNISLPTQALTQTAPYTYQPGNFGGLPAQIPLTSGNPVVHTYTSPNAGYTVTDTAWDQYGGFSQATGTVPVYIGVPYASFTESPTSGQASLLVTFTDTSYRGTASGLSYNWSFGDSSGTNPYSNVIGNTTHVYAYNGVFYPNLTITNANGTSYYVGQPITLSNTQTQTYYLPTQVQLKFTDYNGAPLTGVSVVATPINFSAPAGWINTLLGINPNVNIVGTSVGLNTDTLGVCAMPMVQSIEYSIVVKGTSASNPAETVNTTFNLFPVQTAYEIPLPTNLVPYALPTPQTATTNITYSITNTTGASTQTYTTTYNDATGGTTALQLFVENTTGAWIASSNYTGSAANSETFSQSEPNPNGGTYTWGFLATQAQLGNITQTKTANFPEFINLMGAPGGWPT